MKQVLKYVGYFLLIALFAFLAWRFSFIIVWILIATLISFIGQPLVGFFDRLRIRKLRLSRPFSVLLTLAVIVGIFVGMFAIFVPLLVKQADTISRIDVNLLAKNLQNPLLWLDENLHSLGIIPAGQRMEDFIILKAKSVIDVTFIGQVVNNFFNVAGTFMVGLFSVLFIAFFFMKDGEKISESFFTLIPKKNHEVTERIIADSQNLLRRYFIGVILELIGVMTIITLGLWIFGVDNALLIGFFGGIMNIIPYLGPVIGTAIGMTLGVTATLAAGDYAELMPTFFKLAGVFMVANFIDNNILVPYIYSTSVKAHPLEIFIVIVMAGSLAGIFGMLMAIPVYTVLRVIGRELLIKFRGPEKLIHSSEKTISK